MEPVALVLSFLLGMLVGASLLAIALYFILDKDRVAFEKKLKKDINNSKKEEK